MLLDINWPSEMILRSSHKKVRAPISEAEYSWRLGWGDEPGFLSSAAQLRANGGKFEIKRQDKRHFGNLCLLRN